MLKLNNLSTYKSEVLDGSTRERAALRSIDIKTLNPSAQTGWYWLNINGSPKKFYIDMDYDGGGWVLVMSHPINVSIRNDIKYMGLVTQATYGSSGFIQGVSNPLSTSVFVGLENWSAIIQANSAYKKLVYYTANSAVGLNGTHARRSSFNFSGFGSSKQFKGVTNLSNLVGGTTPGLYSYHIANNAGLSTFDWDNDGYGGNCSTLYNNAPFWYVACWDGSFWGGNGIGYQNAAFWTGSGSDYYNYGAIYIK